MTHNFEHLEGARVRGENWVVVSVPRRTLVPVGRWNRMVLDFSATDCWATSWPLDESPLVGSITFGFPRMGEVLSWLFKEKVERSITCWMDTGRRDVTVDKRIEE